MQPFNPAQPQPTQQPVSAATNIVSGIGAFLQQYRAGTDLEKSRNLADFERDLQMIQAGIPVDHKVVKKHMRGAGLPIDTEGPSKQEIEQQMLAQQSQSQGEGAMTRGAQGVQIPSLTMPPSSLGPGGPPPSTGGAPITQGAPAPMRLPQLSTSPADQWLGQMQGDVAQKRQMAQSQMQIQGVVDNLYKVALGDNQEMAEQARQMLMKVGKLQPLPWDAQERLFKAAGISNEEGSIRMIDMQTGGPERRRLEFEKIKALGEMNEKQKDQVITLFKTVIEQFPNAPVTLAMAHAVSGIVGGPEGLKTFAETGQLLQKTGSKESIRAGEQARKERGEEISRGQRGEEIAISREGLAERKKENVAVAERAAIDDWLRVFDDKNSAPESKETALRNLADIFGKQGYDVQYKAQREFLRGYWLTKQGRLESGGADVSKSKTLSGTPKPADASQPWFQQMMMGASKTKVPVDAYNLKSYADKKGITMQQAADELRAQGETVMWIPPPSMPSLNFSTLPNNPNSTSGGMGR